MNILLNDGYAFQKGIPQKSILNHMSKDELMLAVGFADQSGESEITLNGAEPMYFEDWEFVVDTVLKTANIKSVSIFTNCIDVERNYQSLIRLTSANVKNIFFFINYNDEKTIGISNYEEMLKGISMIRSLPNSMVIMNINLYDLDQDFKTPLKIASDYKTRFVRWSFTNPDEINTYKGDIVDFYQSKMPLVKEFFLECVKYRIRPMIDCHSIPLCMYDEEMLRLVGMVAEENLRKSTCKPFIDVGPGLETSRCFAYRSEKHDLTKYMNVKDISQLFINMIDDQNSVKDLLPQCDSCASKVAQGQSCGCLQLRKVEVL
jgi:hypothetical protein